ncbi:MAG TPA: hypothetical protein VFX61_19070 [Micromonosporaceae bacterium]|nr:hypothetical protein [Micromonosporaceae bacterium]
MQSGPAALPDSAAQRERLRAIASTGPIGYLRHCLTVGIEIRGTVDADELRTRLARLVVRRPALGCVFTGAGTHSPTTGAAPQLHQRIIEAPTAATRWAIVRDIAGFEAERPFSVGEHPLVRATLLTAEPDRHLLVVNLDQLVCDAWSANLVVSDLLTGDMDETPDAYAVVRLAREEWLAGPEGAAAVARRRERIADAWNRWPVRVDNDPTDPHEAVERFVAVDDRITTVLRERVRKARGSMLAMGAVALAAGIAEDGAMPLALRTTLAGRESTAEEAVVGWFANESVLRLPPRAGTVQEYATALRSEIFAALADQRVPYPFVSDALLEGDPAGPSCALVFLPKGLSGGEQAGHGLGDAVATRTAVSICPTGADIDFFMIEETPPIEGSPPAMLTVGATTRRAVASPETVDELLDRWIAALHELARKEWSAVPVAEISR